MKALRLLTVLTVLCGYAAAVGCGQKPAVSATAALETPALTAAPISTLEATTPPTPMPGETIVVGSAADSGPGTLRQALLDGQPGDIITFDPAIFPPAAPQTISVTSALPQISQGYLTVDASDAGVILDGSQLPRDTWITGLDIVSDGNTIRGLQVLNFTGVGIVVAAHGQHNTIGGDRNTGAGPIGQGNLSSGNNFGIGLWDYAANNVVTGNLVGTDASGTAPWAIAAPGCGSPRAGWIIPSALTTSSLITADMALKLSVPSPCATSSPRTASMTMVGPGYICGAVATPIWALPSLPFRFGRRLGVRHRLCQLHRRDLLRQRG